MDGQPLELQDQLAQVDQHFPTNLRDRPYDTQDLLWNGPFYGKGGPQLINNPITGSPVPMAPGTTPDHYLAALNTIVEAKANARANVLRGWNAEQASSQALAKAWGVDPSTVQGQSGKTAQGVIQGQVAGRKEALASQEEQRRASIDQQHVDLSRQSLQQQQDRFQQEDAEKQSRRNDLNSARADLPRMQEYLNSLPADKAMAVAPGILGRLLQVDSPLGEQILNATAMRYQKEQQQADFDARQKDAHLKAIGEAAKQVEEQYKPMFDDLAKTVPVKYADVTDETGVSKKRTPLYDNAFEERLAQITGAINRASSLDPDIGSSADAVLKRIRGLADKQEGLDTLNEFSRRLSASLHQILESRKAGMIRG